MFRTVVATLLLPMALPALAQDTSEAEGEMRKAKLTFDKRDYEAAIGHYLIARSLAPESSGPYLGLGLSYAALGRCPDAVPVLEEYLRRKADNPRPEARQTLNACRAQRGGIATPVGGRLIVLSDPSGAEVRVDDEEMPSGRTPANLSLAPGAHAITVSRPGYRDDSRTVTIAPHAASQIRVTLQPNLPSIQSMAVPNGTLRVEVAPVAGQIQVNGMRIPGERMIYEAPVPPGMYEVSVARHGYDGVLRDVLVRPGTHAVEKVTLLSSKPRLARRNVAIALGAILATGAVAAAIACGVIYGRPSPPTHFGPVTSP
jgi:hypothetical protein